MNHPRRIQLIAHRGNARDYPENTLPAFASALSAGVRCIELDVQLSADGVPVVMHDDELLRTAGRAGSVFELPAAELRQIDVHEPQRFGERFRGTRIPLLTDALALLEGRPEVTLFVEIKRESLTRFGHEQVLASVLQALKGARVHCVVISFDLAAIVHARQIGGLPIGWVLSHYDAHSRLKYEALQPEFLFCDLKKLPAQGALCPGPWRWAVYEIESLPLALSLLARGVEYIETMAVQELSEALQKSERASAPP